MDKDEEGEKSYKEPASTDHPTLNFVASETGRKGVQLHNGFKFCPHTLTFWGISVVCDYPGANNAKFLVDGKEVSTARVHPFTMNNAEGVAPWEDYPELSEPKY